MVYGNKGSISGVIANPQVDDDKLLILVYIQNHINRSLAKWMHIISIDYLIRWWQTQMRPKWYDFIDIRKRVFVPYDDILRNCVKGRIEFAPSIALRQQVCSDSIHFSWNKIFQFENGARIITLNFCSVSVNSMDHQFDDTSMYRTPFLFRD